MARTVLGYHGTSWSAAELIIGGSPMSISRNRWDWLGDGVYFWEYGPVRAAEWARQQHGDAGAVLRATITLEACLDLADLKGTRALRRIYARFVDRMNAVGASLPKQRGTYRGLDRAVINYYAELSRPPIRAVRAPFVEGEPLWPGSGLWQHAHIQIAVRDIVLLQDLEIVEEPEYEQY